MFHRQEAQTHLHRLRHPLISSPRLCTPLSGHGGPIVPIRAGRVDATEIGALGVLEPQNQMLALVARFTRMGFDTGEMTRVMA